MPELRFPQRRFQPPPKRTSRTCAGHRSWVKTHHCSVPGCSNHSIICAHVRSGTDGGCGLKPSDRWTISLCVDHHMEQHQIGEAEFQANYSIDMRALAIEFARKSPYRAILARM